MKTVYSFYCCDILHIGHIEHMLNAKRIAGCDGCSIVGILTDEAMAMINKKPILPFEERMALARSIRYNDVVVAQESNRPTDNILKLKPDILLESASHSDELLFDSKDDMRKHGGQVIIMPYYPHQSSSKIREKIRNIK